MFCPNCPHCWAFFVKVSKSFIFLVKSFLGNFYRLLATLTGHTDYDDDKNRGREKQRSGSVRERE